jgi:hypothetical protein
VVVQRCAQCHDLRTVLAEPRTGASWLSTCRRMQDKPTIDRPISEDEVVLATAYLVAITPSLQESVSRRRDEEITRDEAVNAVDEPSTLPVVADAGVPEVVERIDSGVAQADAGVRRAPRRIRRDAGVAAIGPPDVPPVEPPAQVEPSEEPAPFFYSVSMARQIVNERCATECHGSDRFEEVGGATRAEWSGIVRRMIARGAELDANSARLAVQYLANTYPPR